MSRLTLALFLGCIGSGSAVADIPAGYFTDIQPVLADPLYLDDYPAVTGDGLTMVFTNVEYQQFRLRPGSGGFFDLFMATRTNTDEPFANVVNLGRHVNTNSSEGFAHVSPDGQTLYFGSWERAGGFGIYDIYQATHRDGDFPGCRKPRHGNQQRN